MKILMEFNPDYGRRVLILSAGSPEDEKIIKNYSDEEVMMACFKHGCTSYCFSNPRIVE